MKIEICFCSELDFITIILLYCVFGEWVTRIDLFILWSSSVWVIRLANTKHRYCPLVMHIRLQEMCIGIICMVGVRYTVSAYL